MTSFRATLLFVVMLGTGPLAGCSGPTSPSETRVSGRVTETRPTETIGVSGAIVQVRGGTPWTALTSPDGSFLIPEQSGAVDLRVFAVGYEEQTIHLDTITSAALTIALMPALRTVTETIGSPSGPRRRPTSFFRNIHHDGLITVTNLYFYFSLDDSNPLTRTVEVLDGDRLVAAASTNKQQYFLPALSVRVSGGARYEIRISGGDWGAVTIESPN